MSEQVQYSDGEWSREMSIEQDARAEAEKRYPEGGTYYASPQATNEIEISKRGSRYGFLEGAEWQASRPVTDEEADAAQIAFHEFVFGPDEPLTGRDIGITRQAWKVAIQAARALADKETP